MDREKLKFYTARVTQSNKSQLIVIMFEVIIDGMNTSKVQYDAGDIEQCQKDLKLAQRFLNELMGSLDYRYEISYELLQLYSYVNKKLASAIAKRDPNALENAVSVMEKLLIGFEEVSKEDNTSPVMENTQQLYAGLTYGKGTLNEIFVNVNEQRRGFKA